MFYHVVKKDEVCSMLAKLNVNFRKISRSINSKQIDIFLYKHFARAENSCSPGKIMVQTVEEMIINSISTKRH